jgi:hypothetical protein
MGHMGVDCRCCSLPAAGHWPSPFSYRGEEFGNNWWGRNLPEIHESLIHNRELNPQHLRSALRELEQRGIVFPPSTDEYDYQELKYSIGSPWSRELTRWPRIAEYLDRTHLSIVSSWLDDLDYSVFD